LVELAAAASGPPRPERARPGLTRPRLIVLGALSSFGPLSMDMYLPGLPALSRDLGASAAAAQLTITACMLGLGLGQLVAGPVSDSLGRRRPLIAGVVAYSVASLACAASPSVTVLVAMRLLEGMAGGVGIVIARAIVRDLSGGAVAARMFALLTAITGVAPVCAPLLGGQLLAFTSWRGVFGVLTAVGVPLVAATLIWLPETLPPTDRHGGGLAHTLRTFARLLSDRRFVPYALSFSLAFASMFAYISGSSFVLENVYGATPQGYSLVFAVNSGGLIAMSHVSGRLVGRSGPVALLRGGLIGTALFALGALAATVTHAPLLVLLGCLFALMCTMGLVMPNGVAAAMSEQEGVLGAASALIGVGQFGAGALVAPLVGLGGSHDAVPMGIVIAVAGVAAILVGFLLAPRTVRSRAPSG
jgi:MFS transporter, DHA1 family, multidrug resistance protein